MSTKLAFTLAAAAIVAASAASDASASPYGRAAEVRALASANVLEEGTVGSAGYGRSVYHPEYEASEPVYHGGLTREF
jgi:hypothetical protein